MSYPLDGNRFQLARIIGHGSMSVVSEIEAGTTVRKTVRKNSGVDSCMILPNRGALAFRSTNQDSKRFLSRALTVREWSLKNQRIPSSYGGRKRLRRWRLLLIALSAVLPSLVCADSSISNLRTKVGLPLHDVLVPVVDLKQKDGQALIRGVDFSPNSNRLAIDAMGTNVTIWDWRNGRVDKTLLKPDGANDLAAPNPLSYNPNGTLLAYCEQSGTGNVVTRIWDVASGVIAKDIIGGPNQGEPGGCTAVAFSPN